MSFLSNTIRSTLHRSAGFPMLGLTATSGFQGFRAFSRVTKKYQALKEAKSTFKETFAKLTAPPELLGRTLWENPDRDHHIKVIRDIQDKTGDATGKRRGKIGFHGSPYVGIITNQAFSNYKFQIKQLENSVGQGMFLGMPKDAFDFTGSDILLEIGATGMIEENTQEGTNQNYIVPGTGDLTLLSIQKVSNEYKKHQQSKIYEILISSYREAKEVYHRTLGMDAPK